MRFGESSSPDELLTPLVSAVGATLKRWLPVWILLAVCVGCSWIGEQLWPRPIHGYRMSERCRVRVDIVTIDGALDEYSMHHGGEYPLSLDALVEPDAFVRVGPDAQGYRYLNMSRPPLDPWRRAYLYTPPGPGNLRPIVTSLGRDGLLGGDGDDADVSTITLRAEDNAATKQR